MKFYYAVLILFSITFPQINCKFSIEVFAKYAKQQFLDSFKNLNETQCTADLKQFVEDLSNHKPEAIKMFDATSKLQSGLLQINTGSSGDYDQCLSLSNGQYCTIDVKINSQIINVYADALGIKIGQNHNAIKYHLGVCVPNSCNPQDLYGIVRTFLSNNIKGVELNCDRNQTKSLPARTVGALSFFVIIIAILILSTIYDLKSNKANRSQLMAAFSLYSNSRKLFSCKPNDYLGAVNGIRAITVLWVIMGHTLMLYILAPTSNYIWLFRAKDYLSTSIILAASIGVDSFFTLSGILIIYVHLNAVAQGYDVSISIFFLSRFLRLSPALYATVIFYAGILEHLGEGPYWYQVKNTFVKYCEQNWWATLLFIQTEWNNSYECVTHAWYLAADTQLYFISPIIIYVLRRSPTKFLFGVVIAFLTSSSAAFIITCSYRLGSASLESSPEYFNYIYRPTYIRMMPWLVGLVWGYILFKSKNRKFKLKKSTVVTAWLLSILTFIYLILLHVLIHKHGYNVYKAASFNALARASWGACVGWVIFACANGYGGFINTFLSCPAFAIIARLSYSMYLVHYPIMLIEIYSRRHPAYASHANIFLSYFGFVTATIIVSIFWTLSFELPIAAFQNKIIRKYKIENAYKSEERNTSFE